MKDLIYFCTLVVITVLTALFTLWCEKEISQKSS